MAREIKNNPPGIRSFVHLTAEEAVQQYGGGFSLVGRPFTPPAPAGVQPQRAGAAVTTKPKPKKGKKTRG